MSEETRKRILQSIGLTFTLGFSLVPFCWMVVISLNKSPDFLVREDIELTFKNYIDVLTLPALHFGDYLKNSVIVAGTASIASVTIGSLAAYAVSRINFPGKILFLLLVLALSMFPQVSVLGFLFKLISALGWVNTYNALIFPYTAWSLPLSLWLVLSYLNQIPKEIDKAGLVDGASRLQVFLRIILPISLPGILSAMLLVFIFSFNEFLFALVFTIDYGSRTVPVGIALFEGLHGEIPWGYIMAASVISSLPVILIAIFLQRFIIQGLTGGAVKQ